MLDAAETAFLARVQARAGSDNPVRVKLPHTYELATFVDRGHVTVKGVRGEWAEVKATEKGLASLADARAAFAGLPDAAGDVAAWLESRLADHLPRFFGRAGDTPPQDTVLT